jgi:hypothetical protein
LQNATLAEGQKENALNLQSGYAATDLQSALGKLGQQQPLDTLKAQEQYNKQGLLYSGHLGQALGQINQNYLDKRASDQTSFGRQQAARDAAVAALRSGLSVTQAALAAAAADRASIAAQKNPALGQPSTPLVPAPTKPATGGPVGTPSGVPGWTGTWRPNPAGVKLPAHPQYPKGWQGLVRPGTHGTPAAKPQYPKGWHGLVRPGTHGL